MRYFYTGEKTEKKGHPKQYDGVVDKKNLRKDVFQEEVYDWDGQEVIVYSAIINTINMKRNVKVVIINFKNPNKKIITHNNKNIKIIYTNIIKTSYPILTIYKINPTHNYYYSYTLNKKHNLNINSHLNLFFTPEKHKK